MRISRLKNFYTAMTFAAITPLCVFASAAMAAPDTGLAKRAASTQNATQAKGGEASVTLHSTITGNQEQPKVLYIVPWQGPGGTDQLNTGLQPIVSDVFAPLDRSEFQRELKYRKMAAERQAQ